MKEGMEEKVYGEEGGMGWQMNRWDGEEEMRILEMKKNNRRGGECRTVHNTVAGL